MKDKKLIAIHYDMSTLKQNPDYGRSDFMNHPGNGILNQTGTVRGRRQNGWPILMEVIKAKPYKLL